MKSAGQKKGNVHGFASYYTAIFGSLMSESKTSCVSGERWGKGPSERRDAWTTFSYASHSGCCRTGGTLFDRSSSLLSSFHCCSACTYTSFGGFRLLGAGQRLRRHILRVKNKNEGFPLTAWENHGCFLLSWTRNEIKSLAFEPACRQTTATLTTYIPH